MRLSRYTPNRLFDQIRKDFKLNADADLAEFLNIDHATISRLRHHKCELTARTVLRAHEATEWPVAYIRDLLGDTSEEFFETSKEGIWQL